jgi:hypothetical protein
MDVLQAPSFHNTGRTSLLPECSKAQSNGDVASSQCTCCGAAIALYMLTPGMLVQLNLCAFEQPHNSAPMATGGSGHCAGKAGQGLFERVHGEVKGEAPSG